MPHKGGTLLYLSSFRLPLCSKVAEYSIDDTSLYKKLSLEPHVGAGA